MSDDARRRRRKGRERPDPGPIVHGVAFDAAADLPGRQLKDPDETAAAGVDDQRLPPQRRSQT